MPVFRWTPEWATLYAAGLGVVGSVIGGIIGAVATLRATREARRAERDRDAAREQAAQTIALKGLVRELQSNMGIADAPSEIGAYILFQRNAIDAAEPHLLMLDDSVYAAAQEARLAIARYNALAQQANSAVEAPEFPTSSPHDFGAHLANMSNSTRHEGLYRRARQLATEAKEPIRKAQEAIQGALDDMTRTAPRKRSRWKWWE